jgi:catalase
MAKTTKRLTTAFGIPVANDSNSMTAGESGPVLMQDVHLFVKTKIRPCSAVQQFTQRKEVAL